MSTIPRDGALDSTIFMLRDGYEFIWERCRRFDIDMFETRILGKRTACLHGPDAARLFYDETKMQRERAIPRRVVTSLFGKNAVHTLDGEAHRTRKAAFLSLMTPAALEKLTGITTARWRAAVRRWESAEGGGTVVLFDEAARVLTEAVCTWAGVPLPEAEAPRRARQLTRMVDAFGGAGPRLWKGKLARARTELWIAGVIDDVRRGRLQAERGTPVHVMAHHRDADGAPLDLRTAAVEVLNVIRPTVAIAWYVTFAALALHEHPEWRERIAGEPVGDAAGPSADLFMQEVRRFYPFTPYLGARVRETFEWRGYRFAKGMLVLLDVYGMNHNPKLWNAPEAFRPERFRTWAGGAFDFVPQGGGSREGHRCPGESITMHNVNLALHFLTRCMTYEVDPRQDLGFDLARMPTRPRSGLVLRAVRSTPALDGPAPRMPSRTATRDARAAELHGATRAADPVASP